MEAKLNCSLEVVKEMQYNGASPSQLHLVARDLLALHAEVERLEGLRVALQMAFEHDAAKRAGERDALTAEVAGLKAERDRMRSALEHMELAEQGEWWICSCGWQGSSKEVGWTTDYEGDGSDPVCPNEKCWEPIQHSVDEGEPSVIAKLALASPDATAEKGEG